MAYTFNPPPDAMQIYTPFDQDIRESASGPTAGGQFRSLLSAEGQFDQNLRPFTPGSTVDFCGTVVAAGVSGSYVSVTTPAKDAGLCEVRVRYPDGQVDATPLIYTYVATPTLTVVRPDLGAASATVDFDPVVCRRAGVINDVAASDVIVTVNSTIRFVSEFRDVISTVKRCNGTLSGFGKSYTLTFDGSVLVAGDNVSVALTSSGAAKFADEAGVAAAPVTRIAVAGTPAPDARRFFPAPSGLWRVGRNGP